MTAYFDLTGSEFADKYERECPGRKIKKANNEIDRFIGSIVKKMRGKEKELTKEAGKKFLFFFKTKSAKDAQTNLDKSKEMRKQIGDVEKIMKKFAGYVKTLCASDQLTTTTPTNQQKELWEKFAKKYKMNGKSKDSKGKGSKGKGSKGKGSKGKGSKGSGTKGSGSGSGLNNPKIEKMASTILRKTVKIFSSQCPCRAVIPDHQNSIFIHYANDECAKKCSTVKTDDTVVEEEPTLEN
jgi:hypothetical protein